ncbi:hypothetical protein [Methanococcus voltae]|uniref:Uncharacterized protein n=2 Tax=Methanococcus voltae TaxID=2188 RepID=A0A8J7RMB4_METVO|nr:hypothetical protein [Methanococcus voltae]MBP2172592.1 hypothetical protein [Methanococcus voltae]MBP2201501.1 hypothetical protein [Methanococcus voltae]MCS3922290.1 hypothetical protein [Methanococcus voltae PS]
MKNTISRSFELKDYAIQGTKFGDYWLKLENHKKLKTEISYIPKDSDFFTKEQAKNVVNNLFEILKSFKEQLPENIEVDILFKSFDVCKTITLSNDNTSDKKDLYAKIEDENNMNNIDEILVSVYFIVKYDL